MRKLIIPAVVSAALLVSSLAFAAESTTGKITAMDPKTHTLTLDNGIMYQLPQSYNLTSLKSGEKVSVTWTMENGKHMASAVHAAS
jgi:Protein of unknown function (DUF1344)